jgi:hypothetical protein
LLITLLSVAPVVVLALSCKDPSARRQSTSATASPTASPTLPEPTPRNAIPRSRVSKAEVSVISFSRDGKHLLFKVSGVAQNSGWPHEGLAIIDVARSKVIARTDRFSRPSETHPPAIARLLAKHKIVENNEGETVWPRPGTVPSASSKRSPTFSVGGKRYRLSVGETPTAHDLCVDDDDQAQNLTLTLTRLGPAPISRAIVRDHKPFGCDADYLVHRVVHYRGSIAVALDVVSLGKGTTRNQWYVAVTGSLDR